MYEIYSTQPCAVSNALWYNYRKLTRKNDIRATWKLTKIVSLIDMTSYNRLHIHKSQQRLCISNWCRHISDSRQ